MKLKKPVIYALATAALIIGFERGCHHLDKYIRDKAAESILESDIYGGKHHKQKLSLDLDYPK